MISTGNDLMIFDRCRVFSYEVIRNVWHDSAVADDSTRS